MDLLKALQPRLHGLVDVLVRTHGDAVVACRQRPCNPRKAPL